MDPVVNDLVRRIERLEKQMAELQRRTAGSVVYGPGRRFDVPQEYENVFDKKDPNVTDK